MMPNGRTTWRRRLLRGYVIVMALLSITWAISLLDPVEEILRDHRWIGYALIALVCALSAGAAWLASDHASAPVQELERVRTDFVANASHELKTPVAGIRLLAESIEQASSQSDLEAVGSFSHQLTQESARLQRLVTDLMDLSRLEDYDRVPLGGESCDLAGVIATSASARAARAQERSIGFYWQDASQVEGMRVRMSAADAALVVDNLFSNALAYTEQGEVRVGLRAHDGQAELKVSDTGIGIPLRDQERVFERFYRVDTARSREAGGTGLGLSLVRHAVHRAGGSIQLESEPGVGSTFTVLIPLA